MYVCVCCIITPPAKNITAVPLPENLFCVGWAYSCVVGTTATAVSQLRLVSRAAFIAREKKKKRLTNQKPAQEWMARTVYVGSGGEGEGSSTRLL